MHTWAVHEHDEVGDDDDDDSDDGDGAGTVTMKRRAVFDARDYPALCKDDALAAVKCAKLRRGRRHGELCKVEARSPAR